MTAKSDDEPDTEDAAGADRNFVTALARGLDVLRCFRADEFSLSNSDIAQRTNLPRPTVTRLTHTLCRLGYLLQVEATGQYRLGTGVLQLGYGALAGVGIADRAAEIMRKLQEDGPNPNTTVALGERHRFSVIYAAVHRATSDVSLTMTVGARAPLFRSAIGRAVMCAMPEAKRTRILSELQAQDVEDMDRIRRDLDGAAEEYAQHGYCSSFGDWSPNISGIAVPILSLNGDRIYGMNVGAPAFLTSPEELRDHYAARLIEAARSLSDIPRTPQ